MQRTKPPFRAGPIMSVVCCVRKVLHEARAKRAKGEISRRLN